jgi:hypothetical protein
MAAGTRQEVVPDEVVVRDADCRATISRQEVWETVSWFETRTAELHLLPARTSFLWVTPVPH